jgi:pimeloyl-[acyl-carrier protein] methyl ester esterase
MRRIVLLPGLDGTGTLFDDFVRAAPAGLQLDVVALPAEPLGYVELVERLHPMLRLTSETILVAESFSGPLAIMLAARSRLAGLVLCNSFVVRPHPRALQLLAAPLLFRVRAPSALIRRYLVGPAASNTLVARVRAAIAAIPAAVLASRVRTVLSVDVTSQLAACTVPLLYLRGTEDRLVPDASADAVAHAASVPLSLVRMPGPHLLLQVAPNAVWRAIAETFLQLPAA